MKEKIKVDDLTEEYILSELKKLYYTYGLNVVIRYNLERKEKYQTQSVAEHVYNMLILAHYFRDLEDPEYKMDFEKVTRMILMHDMGEIETGDIISIVKNDEHSRKEEIAVEQVSNKSPQFISNEIKELFEEFENPKTPEGRFAKAIDKFEGQFFYFDDLGIEMIRDMVVRQGHSDMLPEQIFFNKILKTYENFEFNIMRKFLEVLDKDRRLRGMYEPLNKNE